MVFITESVVPYGVQVLFHDRSFVFGLFARVWQEVTVGNVEVKRKNNNSSIDQNQLHKNLGLVGTPFGVSQNLSYNGRAGLPLIKTQKIP